MTKINGLKKAVGDYKDIMARGNYPIIYFDVEEKEIWTNEYTDCNSYTQHSSESIIDLIAYARELPMRDGIVVNMKNVKALAEKACAEYENK